MRLDIDNERTIILSNSETTLTITVEEKDSKYVLKYTDGENETECEEHFDSEAFAYLLGLNIALELTKEFYTHQWFPMPDSPPESD